MKIIENYGVIELNNSELENINGGDLSECTSWFLRTAGALIKNIANTHASGYGTVYSGMI